MFCLNFSKISVGECPTWRWNFGPRSLRKPFWNTVWKFVAGRSGNVAWDISWFQFEWVSTTWRGQWKSFLMRNLVLWCVCYVTEYFRTRSECLKKIIILNLNIQCMKHELNNLRASERVHTFCATFNTLFIPASNSFESAVRTKLTVESASKTTRQCGLYYNTAVTRLFYNSVTVAWCTCFAWLTMSIITSLGGLESQNRHVLETNGLKMACSKANG